MAFVVREILRTQWKRRGKGPKPGVEAAVDWRPKEARARLLLAEADALAAQGLYSEAAHHLLLHSIQDVEDHRPRAIRYSLILNRSICAASDLPLWRKSLLALFNRDR